MEQGKTGRFIAECRREKGYSQKQLAERLSVTEQAVSRWERGIGYPDITLLIPLSKELDVSVIEVMEGCRMKKEVSKQEVEHSIEYYMASSMESREPLAHALTGLLIWLGVFLVLGMFLVFGVSGEMNEGADVAGVVGYYISVGSLISIFWGEKVRKMAVEYGVIAEREYEYQEQEESAEEPPVPFVLLPMALDGYRRFMPGIMPLKRTDGTEMKLRELFLGCCKAAAIMLSLFFWPQMVTALNKNALICSIGAASPLILAGAGLAIHGRYQMVQGRKCGESIDSARLKVVLGIVLAGLPVLLSMLMWSFV